jgi:hypothetical protein
MFATTPFGRRDITETSIGFEFRLTKEKGPAKRGLVKRKATLCSVADSNAVHDIGAGIAVPNLPWLIPAARSGPIGSGSRRIGRRVIRGRRRRRRRGSRGSRGTASYEAERGAADDTGSNGAAIASLRGGSDGEHDAPGQSQSEARFYC